MQWEKEKQVSDRLRKAPRAALHLLAIIFSLEVVILATGCSTVEVAPEPQEAAFTIVQFDELMSDYCPGLKDQQLQQFQNAAHEAEKKFDVNHRLILAVVTVESRCKRTARSPVGARGAMQLMPRTAKWLGVKNPDSIRDNVKGGSKYLAHLLEEFDHDLELALAAYNAGPTNVRRFGGVPPFRETQDFVNRVLETYYDYLAAV